MNMKNIKLFCKNLFSGTTYVKYFLSYLIILTVLILGFFFIIRNQLTNRYFEQRSIQTLTQLDNFISQLNTDMLYLSQVDTAISNDHELLDIRYSTGALSPYKPSLELRKYSDITKLISSIIYLPNKNTVPLSTQHQVTYKDNVFYLEFTGKTFLIDPRPYLDNANGQLVFIHDELTSLLLYFPALSSSDSHIFFYILDRNVLTQQLRSIISQEITSIALLDSQNQIITGCNISQLLPYLSDDPSADGIYHLDTATSLCVCTDNIFHLSVAATLSNNFLTDQINSSFADTYLLLMALGIAGFFLIFFAMRLTYSPLYKLTSKVVTNPNPKESYFEQIYSTFSETESQKLAIQEKLNHYRMTMEQSLLNSMVALQSVDDTVLLPFMNRIFDQNPHKRFFVVRTASYGNPSFPASLLLEDLKCLLPSEVSCVNLNSTENSSTFLIIDPTKWTEKEKRIRELANKLFKERGCLFAISKGTQLPMEIPSLYESTTLADNYWPHIPVVELSSLPPATSSFTYPQEQLDYLSELLKANNFPAVRILIDDLFHLINNYISPDNHQKTYFVRSILIDMLTILINYMNLSNIPFQSYSDLYFETLYYCRNCPYTEKEALITSNISSLLNLCDVKIAEKQILTEPIMQLMQESYCQPNFSIYVLADSLHVSVSYVSYLFKKDMNINFSDLLWEMRLKKAKELLSSTEMSVNEISIAVGYVNTSSFCRKFKLETGMTPSQFRNKH